MLIYPYMAERINRQGDERIYRPKIHSSLIREIYKVKEATAAEPARLEVTVDRQRIRADGQDVVHIVVRVLDNAGRPHPNADNRITFQVEGPGKIIGVDNGDPASHEPFQASQRKAFHGLCLAVVQSTPNTVRIRVDVNSPGLAGQSLVVEAG
jgi:beta-galactosidase